MNFKEYDEIIKNIDMLFLEIYYNLTCNEDFKTFTDEEKEKLINFIYGAYLKDESHTDLGDICDKAIELKEDILNNENFKTWDLLTECSYMV